LEDQT
jgi:E3 ubiquitin-protein ligase RNF213